MAEGRRWEEEEEELRELGRRARGRALSGHSAAGEGLGERKGGEHSDGGRVALGPHRSCPRSQWHAHQDGTPLGGEREGEWRFHPHSHFRVEPEEIHTGLCLLGPRSQTHKFSVYTLNPGAAGLDLVAQVITYLWMSQRPVGEDPS